MNSELSITTAWHEPQPVRADAPVAPRTVLNARKRGYMLVKHGVEWIGAAVLLVLSIPVVLGLTLLLKLTSKGPVFYHQTRLGRQGKLFVIYKFRTMTHECEVSTGPVWSIGHDPRVTKVGRWLRDTHLDELPQLWNILRGDMSLIGPRPERPAIAAMIERSMPEFRTRLLVRPGITGLAQMRMPADADLDTVRRKLAHDLHYIRRMGPVQDTLLVVSTIFHSMGLVATMISRGIVRPFPQLKSMEKTPAVVEPGLSMLDIRIDALPTPAPKETLLWAV